MIRLNLTLILTLLALRSCQSLKLDWLEFQTANCEYCGMTPSISISLCGDEGCCFTPWIIGDFNPGGHDFVGGERLGRCNKFTFALENVEAIKIGLTVFHQGSDAILLNKVKIISDESSTFTCVMPEKFIDNGEHLEANSCYKS